MVNRVCSEVRMGNWSIRIWHEGTLALLVHLAWLYDQVIVAFRHWLFRR